MDLNFTMRRWKSGREPLIPKSIPYYKPLKRGPGRPPKDKGKEPQAQPGRFAYWSEESLEAAAAVLAIRHLVRPNESNNEDKMLSVQQTPQRDVAFCASTAVPRSLVIVTLTLHSSGSTRSSPYADTNSVPFTPVICTLAN